MNNETVPVVEIESAGNRPANQYDAERDMVDVLARQFGHIALRHENEEISDEAYKHLFQLYVAKAAFNTSIDDPQIIARNFTQRVEAMREAALEDVEAAKAASSTGELPDYTYVPNENDQDGLEGKFQARIRALEAHNTTLREELSSANEENNRLIHDTMEMRQQLRQVARDDRDRIIAELREELNAMHMQESMYSHH